MKGKFPSSVLWPWRKGRVPSLCLLTRAPTAQVACGCLVYLGTLFYFLTSDTTLGSFSSHCTPAPHNFAQFQSFLIFKNQSLLEWGATMVPLFFTPPFFLPSAYPDPHPLSQISFPSLGSFPTISQGHESPSYAVTTTALGGPASPGATVCIQQKGENPKGGGSLLISRT